MTPSELKRDKDGNLTYSKGADKKTDETHICNKEAILAQITTDIKGIHGSVKEIKDDVKEVNSQYRELLVEVTKVNGSIDTFKAEVRAAVLATDKGFSKTTKIIGIVIAVIMMFFAYQNLTTKTNDNGKRIEAVQDTLRQEMRYQGGISKKTRSGYVKYNDHGLSDSVKIK